MSKMQPDQYTDELREEGVTSRGYGVLPKFPMLDADLSIEAKGIYAYFCSYRGAGNSAFPRYQKIISDLRVNKDTYYKYFRQLTENEYIGIRKAPSATQGFMKNIYEIKMHPSKFNSVPEVSSLSAPYSLIRTGDLEDAGRGVIPKLVMTDPRLSIRAKAVYAYLCAFAGNGDSACPKKDTMMKHLNVSRNSLDAYLKELRVLNYVTVVQRHVDGHLSVNDYILNRNPDADNPSVTHQVCVIETNSDRQDTVPQMPKSSEVRKLNFDLQVPRIQEVSVQEVSIQEPSKSEAKNNKNLKNNNSLSGTDVNHPMTMTPADARKEERKKIFSICKTKNLKHFTPAQRSRQDEFVNKLAATNSLSSSIGEDKKSIRAAVEVLTDDEILGCVENAVSDEEKIGLECFCLYRDALIDMIFKHRQETLIMLKDFVNLESFYIEYLYDAVFPIFNDTDRRAEIERPDKYMKACLINALKKGKNEVMEELI